MKWTCCLETANNYFKGKGLWEKRFSREDELMSCILSDSKARAYIRAWMKKNERAAKKQIMKKSLEQAQAYNEAGHNEFKNKNYTQSIQYYTKSAYHAPKDSCDLSKAIANRSAALFYLNRYNFNKTVKHFCFMYELSTMVYNNKDCIKDIDVALSWGYPAVLSYKLYLRKARCYIKLHSVNGTETFAYKLQKILDTYDNIKKPTNDEHQKTGQLLKECFLSANDTCSVSKAPSDSRPEVAFGINSEFPYASSGISKSYSQEKGNHVVANRKIKAGQILFVEKPVACLLEMALDRKDICDNCCSSYTDVPIPCTMCLHELYCSIECFNEALTSHHYWECRGYQIGFLKEVGIIAFVLRTLLNCTTIIDTSRFNELYNLMTNMEKIHSSDLVAYGISAAMLIIYLSDYTDYFEVHDLQKCLFAKFSNDTCNFSEISSISKDSKFFVGCLILRYCLQLVCNAQSMTKVEMIREPNIVFQGGVQLAAAGIFPSASIMNHSCKANIVTMYAGQYLIVRAAKDIAEGEEVLNGYGPQYRHMTTKDRQEALKQQYWFLCTCEACTLPKYQNFLEKYEAHCCRKCKNILYKVNGSDYPEKCENCSFTPCRLEYEMALEEVRNLCNLADCMVELERFSEAVQVTEKLLAIRKSVLYKYHKDIVHTLGMLSQTCVKMGAWLKAISYKEEVLLGLISRLGPRDLSVAQEQSVIVHLCLKYLETDNVPGAHYRETVTKIRMYLSKIDDIISFKCGNWSDTYAYVVEESKKILDTLAQDRP